VRLVPAVVVSIAAVLGGSSAIAQSPPRATGWEISGIPALNFNSDEGFGYGAIVQAFNYGSPAFSPYRYTIQPTVLLTTKGRRDVILFFDAPRLLPGGWRIGALAAREQHLATPYYGIGNSTAHDEAAEEEPNPYYYRYGRTVFRLTSDVQRPIGHGFRVLFGAGVKRATIDLTPFDSGTTLLSTERGGAAVPTGRTTYARTGIVYDTRDREIGPSRGLWAEGLVQFAGGTSSFTRATITARGYTSPIDRVTLAQRVIVQNVSGTLPFHELFAVQGSFKDEEGLGGNVTLRGWPKNRFAGKGMALTNSEVRWRAVDFSLGGRQSSVVLNGFVDAGRVWTDRVKLSEAASDLHVGYGGGVRLVLGRSFVISTDIGHSKESAAAIYIGTGYVF
jgi:hypothetical protein